MTDRPSARRLDGRIAIVTGGSGGIGEGMVRRFVEAGGHVAIADVLDEPGAALADELGDAAIYVHLDVTDSAAWDTAVAAVELAFGPVGVLVNNAGIGDAAHVENYDARRLDRVMRTDFEGVLMGMRAVVPSLRRAGRGSIINMSSLQGVEADVGLLSYVAAKFAVRGITKVAALEFGKDGIRVNSIHPGLIRSSTVMRSIPDDFMGRIPLARPGGDRGGVPADVAGLALYLASDASSYVTAAELVVDGGKSIRFPSLAADHSAVVEGMRGSR